MGNNEVLSLEKVSQVTIEEAYEEAIKILQVVDYYEIDANNPDVFVNIMKEFLHWIYATPGTHDRTSDMLTEIVKEKMVEEMGPMSTDATPPKTND